MRPFALFGANNDTTKIHLYGLGNQFLHSACIVVLASSCLREKFSEFFLCISQQKFVRSKVKGLADKLGWKNQKNDSHINK